MCGINLAFNQKTVNQMNRDLSHRGYRDTCTYLTNDLYLGHVRLPIQGLSEDDDHPQEVDGYIGAFVGEFLNYKDFDPNETSDLRVFMRRFAKEGINAFKYFDGFWSVILFCPKRRLTWIFTDYLAKKPLYIRTDVFGISSEIEPLTKLGPCSFDEIYFSSVLKWGYLIENRTPFCEIQKIPPGFVIVLDKDGKLLTSRQYTDLKPNRNRRRLMNSLDFAVKKRLVSDIPVSLLLSGGLDSTIIYYLARKYTDQINAFYVENGEEDFLNFIDFRPQDTVTKIDIKRSISSIVSSIDHILVKNGGPVDLGSMIPQHVLAEELQKRGVNVCLSGDGADELFGGYKRAALYDSQYSDIFHELVYYHLPRLDKLMMAHTIELRCPFLSRAVIEKAMGLPRQLRINKAQLKLMFEDIIPEAIIQREKKPLRIDGFDETDKIVRRQLLVDRYKSIYRKKGGINER